MEFQKITNFLYIKADNKDLPNLLLKNGLKFMINQKEIITQIKKLELRLQCQDQIYVIVLMHILL